MFNIYGHFRQSKFWIKNNFMLLIFLKSLIIIIVFISSSGYFVTLNYCKLLIWLRLILQVSLIIGTFILRIGWLFTPKLIDKDGDYNNDNNSTNNRWQNDDQIVIALGFHSCSSFSTRQLILCGVGLLFQFPNCHFTCVHTCG